MENTKEQRFEITAMLPLRDYKRLATLPGDIANHVTKAVESYLSAGRPRVPGFTFAVNGHWNPSKFVPFNISTKFCADPSFFGQNNAKIIARAVFWYLSQKADQPPKGKYSAPVHC